MRAVCKVRELTLLLRVGTLWRCGDGIFLEVPPLASDALLTTPRCSLFIVGRTQKSHAARSELNSVFILEKVDRWNPIRTSAIQSRSRPMRFLGLSNYEKGAPRRCKKCIACQERYFEKRPSSHLHKVPTRSNKVSPRTFQSALIHYVILV
jgi:hypothetical protein